MLGAWTLTFAFEASELKWLSFTSSRALAALTTIGLTVTR